MLVKFIEMIERNAEEMTGEMKEKLLSDPATSSFKTLPDRKLHENIFEVYSRLGHWLIRDGEKGELPTYYLGMGEKRFEEGFPLHEVIQAMVATKRHIWGTIMERGIMQTAKELDSAVDFITHLNRFFDMAIYYTTRGYYRALHMKTAS